MLHFSFFIFHPTTFILYSTSFIFNTSSFILHPLSFIFYPSTFILYPTSFIFNTSSFIIHPLSFIFYPSTFILYPSFFIFQPYFILHSLNVPLILSIFTVTPVTMTPCYACVRITSAIRRSLPAKLLPLLRARDYTAMQE